MTILHHAVHGNGNEQPAARSNTTATSQAAPSQERPPSVGAGRGGGTQSEPPSTSGERLPTVTEGGGPADGQASEEVPFVLDPRLPVIQAALAFARANLWMPEVRTTLPFAVVFEGSFFFFSGTFWAQSVVNPGRYNRRL